MRDDSNGRRGFDRVLIAVAATFVTLSAGSALAQSAPERSPSDLAIDAAVPMPEPANLPPPSIGDFKIDTPDTTASVTPATAVEAPKLDAAATSAPAAAPEPAAPAASATAPAVEPAKDAIAKEIAKDSLSGEPAKQQAAEPSAEPAKTASAVAPADQPVADKLRELLGAKSSRYFDRKGERAAVEKFYTARDFAPLWTQAGAATPVVGSVAARLKDAAADGLNPADYPQPDFAAATSPEALAEAELKFTASVLDYARQAQSGRMHWSQVSGDIQYPEHPIDPAEVLANVTTAKDPSAALASYNPPHKMYRQLKAKLAELRGQGDGPGAIQIADGPTLKYTAARKKQAAVEVDDPRVPQLRAKLGISENPDSTRYDAKVAEAVRKFQDGADLKETGVLDERTVKALNSPKSDRQIDTVIVNMERWRWLPRELGAPALGDAYVILNIPDYTLKVMQHGAQVWTTRVVVGKPGNHATPLLTETMKYITVNPTWNVPPSIIYNEYLPALQQDPGVLDRMGLKLVRNRDGSIHISQPPGERNALGRIRFNFPNKFLVYQHDTPDKNLFSRDARAFSHGCMRVQNPDQYAATLLSIAMPNERYTPEKIRGMYGKSEIDLKFATPIPVNLTYQTAFVDDAGKLQVRKDIYGRDAAMLAILRNPKGKDLENVVAHAQPSYARPRADIPQGVAFNDGAGNAEPSFFERLFGAPSAPPPANRRPQRNVFTR
ncbi:murein L,D-transpeptidase YcbB/YkuD [Rhodopseudomonas rhenobacensis]|uniref:Murein L,D-transpeptidase YcbB/YkuD n=1 Tax=Rhodopseudomonas rhenobacensis TaxID=87461 RepID=A0A7W7Z3R8_9BRAD|nr:L,D-transpeptidase family protein [Rhodopseudomonas rhenobacensis]MBB5047461.1 murein L,D-transpeptidase YcbB/YkuD [Rhodopseudomonas rhenobacensis]